jgi:hypothetical protein
MEAEDPMIMITISVIGDRTLIHVPSTLDNQNDSAGCVDHSGSMGGHRSRLAGECMEVVQAASSHASFYGFGNTSRRIDMSSVAHFAARNEGTALVCAAQSLASATQDGVAFDANVIIITDCEGVSDHAAAFAVVQKNIDFTNRRILLIGIGSNHTIHDLQALIPNEYGTQVFYLNVDDSTTITPASLPRQNIRDILHSVPVKVRGTTHFLLPGSSFLLPIGTTIEEVHVQSRALIEIPHRIEHVEVTPASIQDLSNAAASNLTRMYNAALASLRLKRPASAGVVESTLAAVRALAAAEVESLQRIVDGLPTADGVADLRSVIASAESFATTGVVPPAHDRRAVATALRRSPAETSDLQLLQDIRDMVNGPPTSEAVAAATDLLNMSSRGMMGSGRTAKLLSRVAGKQNLQLYADVHAKLTALPHADAVPNADADALDAVYEPGTFECVVSAEYEHCCLVAVGALNRRPLVGAVDPQVSFPTKVGRVPYDFRAAHTCLDNPGHCFRSDVGDVNGIVGVFPGNSRAGAVALPAILSEIGTGDWKSPCAGLKALLALLVGVEHVLAKTTDRAFARVLAVGWAGVAARTSCRIISCKGEVEPSAVPVSGLHNAHALMQSALAEPLKYLGPQICRPSLWEALLFAVQVVSEVLGEERFGLPCPVAFRLSLEMEQIASAAKFVLKPKSNPDQVAAFDAERKALAQFQSTIVQRVGLKTTEAVNRALAGSGFLQAAVPMDFNATDFSQENEAETAFLNTHLWLLQHASGETRRRTRAAFWKAVSLNGANTLAVQHAYEFPESWEAEARAAEAEKQEVDRVANAERMDRVCRTTFRYAAGTLPVMFVGYASVTFRKPGSGQVTRAGMSTDPTLQTSTGLLKDVNCSMDSPGFLVQSTSHYLSGVLGLAKMAMPHFHARMAATYKHQKTLEALTAAAKQYWAATASAVEIERSVYQWLTQQQVFECVTGMTDVFGADVSGGRTAEDICVSVGVDAHAPAADWSSHDAALRAEMYGTNVEWSYSRAVVEFVLATRRDRSVDGVFDPLPFLRKLSVHRAFVTPYTAYKGLLEQSGVFDVSLEKTIRDIYEDMVKGTHLDRLAVLL